MAQTNVQAFSGDVAISSNLAVDTNTLFVDSVGNKVGIGMTNPQATLDVAGSSSSGKSLQLRSGDQGTSTDSSQIIFSYSNNPYNSSGYAHSLRTRHNGGADTRNAIDFWLWNTTDTTNESTLGNKRVMTIEGNGRVGIGTDAPQATLDVVGDVAISSNLVVDTNTLFVDSVGNNVGIGTTSPTDRLDVHYPTPTYGASAGNEEGSLTVSAGAEQSNAAVYFRTPYNAAAPAKMAIFSSGGGFSGANTSGLHFCVENTNNNTTKVSLNNSRMVIKSDGNVGIGTANPVGVNGGQRLEGSSSTGFEYIATRDDTTGNSGDFVGAYLFKNLDTAGTEPHYAGMSSKLTGTNGPMDLRFHTNRDNYEADIPQMIISGAGNVGIGITNPQADLTIFSSASQVVDMESVNNKFGFRFASTDATNSDNRTFRSGIYFDNDDNYGAHNMNFCVTGVTGIYNKNVIIASTDAALTIQRGTRNVGIGTTNPSAKLDVNGSTRSGHDTDTTSYFGRSAIGYVGHSDWAGFAHLDRENGSDFALLQNSGGQTILNCKSDQKIAFSSGDTAKMTMLGTGNVGIGTADPQYRLEVGVNTSTVSRFNVIAIQPHIMWKSATAHWQVWNNGTDTHLRFWCDADRAYLQCSGANDLLNFTGQHRTFIKDVPFSRAGDLEGLIVSSDQNKYIKMSGGIECGTNAITVNESLPVVSVSNVFQDKRCFGVISTSEDPDTRQDKHGNLVSIFDKEGGDTRVYINSVGEGAIWVTDINGSLESGDYITTSNVAGYGQKQDSEFLANYTVAKITMDCDFEPVTQSVQIIRKEMGDVNYWVKTTYKNVSEEEYSNLTEENRRIVDDIYQRVIKEGTKTEKEGYELEVRQELVNVLDEHGQIQWEDHPAETEKAYKIRYLDASGSQTDEANHVHKAAFVGCTYHCG